MQNDNQIGDEGAKAIAEAFKNGGGVGRMIIVIFIFVLFALYIVALSKT